MKWISAIDNYLNCHAIPSARGKKHEWNILRVPIIKQLDIFFRKKKTDAVNRTKVCRFITPLNLYTQGKARWIDVFLSLLYKKILVTWMKLFSILFFLFLPFIFIIISFPTFLQQKCSSESKYVGKEELSSYICIIIIKLKKIIS